MVDSYEADVPFEIVVIWDDWMGSPRRDFTVMVYSADGNDVMDEDGNTNMLHADGQSPSEFNYIAGLDENREETVHRPAATVVETAEAVETIIEEVDFYI